MSCFVLIASLLFGFSPASPTDDEAAAHLEKLEVTRKWMDNNLATVRIELDHIVRAYELDEAIMPEVWQQMYRLMAEQYFAERRFFSITVADENLGPDEVLNRSNEFFKNMPLRPDTMIKAVEELLGKGDFPAQRLRWKELRDLRAQINLMSDEDMRHRAGLKVRMIEEKQARICILSETGKPIPQSVYWQLLAESRRKSANPQHPDNSLDASKLSPKSVRFVNSVFRRRNPGEAKKDTAPKAVNKAIGPAESESVADSSVKLLRDDFQRRWNETVDDYCQKDQLSGQRAAEARALAQKMWKRVEDYRAAHREAYEQVESMDSWQAWRMEMSRIDGPLMGLLEELKLRLESYIVHQSPGTEPSLPT